MKRNTFKLKTLSRLLLVGALSTAPLSVFAESAVGSTLEDFFTAALDYSPRLRISEQRKAIGDARRDAATGQLKPQISAQATFTDNRRESNGTTSDFDGERYSIQLRQVLFNWEAFSARKQAISEQDRSEAEYYYELSVLLTEVAEKYFNVLQAQGELTSKSAELDAVKNQVEEIQGKFDRQLVQITDLLQVQASLAAVEAEQIRLQSDLDLTREALRSVSGLDVGKLFDLAKSANAPAVNEGIAAWVAKANDNNFQIKAKQHGIDATKAEIEKRRGAYFPQASLVVQRQDSDVGFDNAPIRENETTYVGVDITIPIYMGGTRGANLREARSLHSIAKSELDQIKLDTSEFVRSAFFQLKASESSIRAAKILVDSTSKAADAMQKGFDLGTVTSVDVLNAIRDRYEAERQLQKAKYDNIKFYLLLKREAGALEASDMVEVSSWLTSTAGMTKQQNDTLFASSTLGD